MTDTSKPACLGGPSTFSPALAMAHPRLPDPDSLLPSFRAIISSGQLTKGVELEQFEKEAAAYLGVEHCIGVSSCTSGLMLCLQDLKRNLKAGKSNRVAVPSFTFLASITALMWAGLEPVFVDTDPETMLISLADLQRVLKEEDVSAVLAVHCFGNPVPRDQIENMCKEASVPLMFDAAHGFGSIHQGKKVGGAGWCEVFSLTPTKMVVAGEGGVIATNDSQLAANLRTGREYGNDGSYDTVFPGLNARLSELHSVLARGSLGMLEEVVEHRNKIARSLIEEMTGIPGISFQKLTAESRSTYKDFTITIDADEFGLTRDEAATALLAEGIPSRKYFSPPCHLHQAFRHLNRRDLPGTEKLSEQCLSLPLLEQDSVAGIVLAFQKLQSHAADLKGALGPSPR